MKQFKFNTNINCSGCVAAVTPHLNRHEGIKKWEVDTSNPNKILTVEAESLNENQLKRIVEGAGFKTEMV